MKNFLQKITLPFLLFISFSLNAQNPDVSLLMEKISNDDAYILMLKTMSPRLNSEAGSQIIAIGKKATTDLIPFLDKENKGIAVHFMLSEIWKEKWEEEICCNISYNDTSEIVIINGLKIYIEGNKLFSKTDDLKKNKEIWKKFSET